MEAAFVCIQSSFYSYQFNHPDVWRSVLCAVWPLASCVCRGTLWDAVAMDKDPPEILIRPQDQTVATGGIVSFFCSAIGNPKPQIEWRKNGKRVSNVRYMVIEMPNGSVLRIEPVRVTRDEAKYECVAENGAGDAVSAEAVLTVHDGRLLVSLESRISNLESRFVSIIQCIIARNYKTMALN
uniref:Ig-like domain-containing protein n=1 Tax=Strigamia maritima TaxID=126957 RepID=T1JHT9_STRMM